MVSKTKQTWNIRDNKKKNQGRARKNALANHGTTPTAADLFKIVDAASAASADAASADAASADADSKKKED